MSHYSTAIRTTIIVLALTYAFGAVTVGQSRSATTATSDGRSIDPAPFVERYTEWAAAPGLKKLALEPKDLSLVGGRPVLSRRYIREHFNNFRVRSVKVCPLINNGCQAQEPGYELTFDVVVSGQRLRPGTVQFDREKRIVKYDGPRNELTRIISPDEALNHAKARCESGGIVVDPEAPPEIGPYLRGGVNIRHGHLEVIGVDADPPNALLWRFKMKGNFGPRCIGMLCTVDAVTGKAKVSWMCL